MLTDNDVKEFQQLFNIQFGVMLSQDVAYRKLTMLVRQMELIYEPISQKQYEQYVNKDEQYEELQKSLSK